MDEDTLKKIIEKIVKPIKDQLNDPDTGLKRINNQIDANSASLQTVEQYIKAYGDMYQINNTNDKRLEKRIKNLEDHVGIQPPPELTLAKVM